MRFFRDGAVAHRAGVEALDDLACGLDFRKRNGGAGGDELEQIAQHDGAPRLVDRFAVGSEEFGVVCAHRTLQERDDLRCDQVFFAAGTPGGNTW